MLKHVSRLSARFVLRVLFGSFGFCSFRFFFLALFFLFLYNLHSLQFGQYVRIRVTWSYTYNSILGLFRKSESSANRICMRVSVLLVYFGIHGKKTYPRSRRLFIFERVYAFGMLVTRFIQLL